MERDKFVSIRMKNHIYLTTEVVQVKNERMTIVQKLRNNVLLFKKMKIAI